MTAQPYSEAELAEMQRLVDAPRGSVVEVSKALLVDMAEKRERARWLATVDALRAELGEARADLRDYGRHNEGCNGPFPPHPCKCGWDEVSAALSPEPGGAETRP